MPTKPDCKVGIRAETSVIAGFMPIPLKIFTWASGIVGVPLPAFVAAMFVVYFAQGVILNLIGG